MASLSAIFNLSSNKKLLFFALLMYYCPFWDPIYCFTVSNDTFPTVEIKALRVHMAERHCSSVRAATFKVTA